jgi:hypothetical protein
MDRILKNNTPFVKDDCGGRLSSSFDWLTRVITYMADVKNSYADIS